jgi:hypothetical protein
VGAVKRDFKRLGALVAGCLLATGANFSSPAMAADYPPSVEVLEVGKPLAQPIPTRVSGTTAVVPLATADVIPIVIGEPVTVTSARLSTKTLTNALVESTPIKLTTSLTLGGIGADEKAPVATISSSKRSEVQIPVDVPTRVTVTGLKAAATGTASFVDASGKSVSLGKIKVSSSGRVTIPALKFAKKNVSYTIRLIVGGKTTSFTIRATS